MEKTKVTYTIGDVPVANETEMSDKDREFLDAAFTYHSPTGDQITDLQAITIAGRTLAATILAHVPPSADRSTALRLVREARMWANSGIVNFGKL
jgi:hypothetical protein